MSRYTVMPMLLIMSVCCCHAEDDKGGGVVEISSAVPRSMMIANIPFWGLDHPRMRSDLNQDIRRREVDYTWNWLERTIKPDLLCNVNKEDFRFLSALGNNKDDALMMSWNKDELQITIIDGRFLVLLVRIKNKEKIDVDEIFRKVVNYSYHANQASVKVRVENLSINDSKETWGRVVVNRGNARGWFEYPIEWYTCDNEVIFAFEKITRPQVSKIAPKDVSYIVGGMSLDDGRSYLRFDNFNREFLANEYYKKIKRENVVHENIDKETKGLPLYH